jgi:hypothetical protein
MRYEIVARILSDEMVKLLLLLFVAWDLQSQGRRGSLLAMVNCMQDLWSTQHRGVLLRQHFLNR